MTPFTELTVLQWRLLTQTATTDMSLPVLTEQSHKLKPPSCSDGKALTDSHVTPVNPQRSLAVERLHFASAWISDSQCAHLQPAQVVTQTLSPPAKHECSKPPTVLITATPNLACSSSPLANPKRSTSLHQGDRVLRKLRIRTLSQLLTTMVPQIKKKKLMARCSCSTGKVLGGAWPTWSDWPSSQRRSWVFFRLFFEWHRFQRRPRFLRNEHVLASMRANDTLSHRPNKEHARKSFSCSSISARCCDVCVCWCVDCDVFTPW